MRRRPKSPPLKCPRCAYSQVGEIDTWQSACPIRGRCVECGHEFVWADVFFPGRRDVPWSIEHAERWAQVPWRLPWTLLRSTWPAWWWRGVSVNTRSSPRRQLEAIAWTLALGWALSIVPITVAAGLDRARIGWNLSPRNWLMTLTFDDLLFDIGQGLWAPMVFGVRRLVALMSWHDRYIGAEVTLWAMPMAASLLWMAMIGLFPVTRRMARLSARHVLRAGLGSFVMLAAGLMLWRLVLCTVTVVDSGQPWSLFIPFAATFWVLLWWISALRVGWEIRSWTLAVLGTTAAFLAGLVGAFWVGELAARI